MTIGIISDTHGLLRPEALDALAGVSQILHAGDIGAASIIPRLEEIAPVAAIRGNVDGHAWARSYPETLLVNMNGVTLYLLHDLQALQLDPVAEKIQVVISGHSHQPQIVRRHGVLYLNPGSAGPRRFRLPVTLAKLELDGELPQAEIIPLDVI